MKETEPIDQGGISRRSVLAGLIAVAAAPPIAQAAPSPAEKVKTDADELAASLKAMHGGEWSVRVDHHLKLVLIISEG